MLNYQRVYYMCVSTLEMVLWIVVWISLFSGALLRTYISFNCSPLDDSSCSTCRDPEWRCAGIAALFVEDDDVPIENGGRIYTQPLFFAEMRTLYNTYNPLYIIV